MASPLFPACCNKLDCASPMLSFFCSPRRPACWCSCCFLNKNFYEIFGNWTQVLMERHKLVALSFFSATWVLLGNWIQALNKALERLSGVVWPVSRYSPRPLGPPLGRPDATSISFAPNAAWQRHQFILCAIRLLLSGHTHARLNFPIVRYIFLYCSLFSAMSNFWPLSQRSSTGHGNSDWLPPEWLWIYFALETF